jgi:hypothetical protein
MYSSFFTFFIKLKDVGHTWLSGNSSCTLVVPKAIAQQGGIYEPGRIVIENVKDGILIRRLELD